MNLHRIAISLASTCAVVGPAMSQPSVTVTLSSTVNGATVKPGTPIDWTLSASVSAADNLGLALLAVDLLQDPDNPHLLDLSPGVPDPAMADFDQPNGYSNPGPLGLGSGFGGTPAGPSAGHNLLQIGGAQNIFGVAGQTAGWDVAVDGGIGQNGEQVIATGGFLAPSTGGSYSLALDHGRANVLEAIQSAPGRSPVISAVVTTAGGIMFVVAGCTTDLTGDGTTNSADLAQLLGAWGPNPGHPADLGGDDQVDAADLAQLLGAWGPCAL